MNYHYCTRIPSRFQRSNLALKTKTLNLKLNLKIKISQLKYTSNHCCTTEGKIDQYLQLSSSTSN